MTLFLIIIDNQICWKNRATTRIEPGYHVLSDFMSLVDNINHFILFNIDIVIAVILVLDERMIERTNEQSNLLNQVP